MPDSPTICPSCTDIDAVGVSDGQTGRQDQHYCFALSNLAKGPWKKASLSVGSVVAPVQNQDGRIFQHGIFYGHEAAGRRIDTHPWYQSFLMPAGNFSIYIQRTAPAFTRCQHLGFVACGLPRRTLLSECCLVKAGSGTNQSALPWEQPATSALPTRRCCLAHPKNPADQVS